MLTPLLGLADCGHSRKECESGAASIEFAGIVMVVAILIGGLIGAAPDLGREISCKIIGAISGGEYQCGAADNKAKEDKHKPTEPCTVSQKLQSISGGAKGVVVSAEVNGGIITEKLSNGHYRVTYKGGAKGGATTGEGGGVEVTVNNETHGEGGGADASANLAAEGGVSFEVDSEQAKDALHQYILREIVTKSVGPAGQAVSALVPVPDGYQPPRPTEVYGQIGEEGSVSAEAESGVGSLNGEAGAAAAVGAKYNLETGDVTTYYKVNAQATGSGTVAGYGGELGLSGEMVVAVKTKKDDPNKVLNVSVTGTYNGQIGAKTPLGTASVGAGQVWTASVDLTSAEQDKIARNILAAAKVPGYDRGQNSGENINEVASTFINAAVDRGVLTRRNVSKNSVKTGVKAEAKDGLVVGVSLSGTEENIEYSNGQYFSDGKWKPMEGC